jgi:hypothetical protein
MLVPYMERTCVDNRREFIGIFEQLHPLVYQTAFFLALTSAGLVFACRRRLPKLSIGCLTGTALVLLYFTFQSLWILSPHLSDAWAGKILREQALPDDMVIMGNIEEFEYGMSLRYYAKCRIFIVQRGGLPEFGFPLTSQENFLIKPENLQELWQGHRRIFVLIDECAPEDYLTNGVTLETRNGKRLITNQSLLAKMGREYENQ